MGQGAALFDYGSAKQQFALHNPRWLKLRDFALRILHVFHPPHYRLQLRYLFTAPSTSYEGEGHLQKDSCPRLLPLIGGNVERCRDTTMGCRVIKAIDLNRVHLLKVLKPKTKRNLPPDIDDILDSTPLAYL